jgi:hypothetical protein
VTTRGGRVGRSLGILGLLLTVTVVSPNTACPEVMGAKETPTWSKDRVKEFTPHVGARHTVRRDGQPGANGMSEEVRSASFDLSSVLGPAALLGAAALTPAPTRIDRCSEITKCDSLRLFLAGTPHNHRAPPA